MWRTAANAGENGGYPVVCAAGEGLRGAQDWNEVAAWVKNFRPTGVMPTLSGQTWTVSEAAGLAYCAYEINSDNAAYGGYNITLDGDINLHGGRYSGRMAGAALQWPTIATYSGVLDGKLNSISNVSINGTGTMGFVQNLTGGTIQNLTLASGTYNAGYNVTKVIGVFAGKATNATLRQCLNYIPTEFARNADTSYTGGIVGQASNTLVTNCANFAHMGNTNTYSIPMYGGGIVGKAENGCTISNCYNAGDMHILNVGMTGAIVSPRDLSATVSNCWYDTQTSGSITAVAGVTGVTTAQMKTWGMAYQLSGAPDLSTAPGTVWRTAASAGENSGYPVLCAAGEGLRAASSWREVGEWVNTCKPTGYVPTLSSGTWTVSGPEQLAYCVYMVNTDSGSRANNITLSSNIALGGERYTGGTKRLLWSAPGSYSGVLDGGGHTLTQLAMGSNFISNLAGGTLQNLTFDGSCTITSTGHGGLIQQIMGTKPTVRNVYSATVIACGYGAGIVVYSQDCTDGLIEHCGVTGDITCRGTGNYAASGIANYTESTVTIRDCYYVGTITVTSNLADTKDKLSMRGIGGNNPIIENCYFGGQLVGEGARERQPIGGGSVRNCYYDSELGSFSSGGSGTARTTAQMKSRGLADALNAGRTGADRVWYTSLDSEITKGYPTFNAPAATVQVTIDPARGEQGYGTVARTFFPKGSEITDSYYRIRPEFQYSAVTDATFSTELTNPGWTMRPGTYYTQNRYLQGSTNANKNAALMIGSSAQAYSGCNDVSQATRGDKLLVAYLHTSNGGGNDTRLHFLAANAYNSTETRYVVLSFGGADGKRYEIQATVKPVTSKTVNVTVPVNSTIELTPGVADKAYTAELYVQNNGTFPITGSISKVTAATGTGLKALKPVAQSVNVTGADAPAGNVHLGVTDPATPGSPAIGSLYYDPASEKIPFSFALGANKAASGAASTGGKIGFRYFMDYGTVLNDTASSFRYDVVYTFGVSEADVALGGAALK